MYQLNEKTKNISGFGKEQKNNFLPEMFLSRKSS